MHITRQGTFASRENIAIGYWRCVYFKEDCSIIYLRPWSIRPTSSTPWLEGESDQPKPRRTSRGRVPAPEKGQGGVHVPPGLQPSSKSMAQPARPSPIPARSGAEGGERRGRTKGFYTQKDPFTGEDATPRVRLRAVPELLRPHHGMPPVPWAAVAAMIRAMTITMSGSFPRACLGPLVRPMSHGPTEMTIGQGPRLEPARIVAALRVMGRVEENIDLAKVDARILARPDKGMIVAGIPAATS